MSLKNKTISGLFWSFGQQASVQGINFIVQIILARILLPEAFGLIAMLQIFMAISMSLLEGGMTLSLIRTKNPDQSDYSTVFYINLLTSFVLYGLLFITAPLIASFYNQHILTDILRIYSLTIIIQAFAGVQMAKLTKEMRFKLQAVLQVPSMIVGGAIGIIMAIQGYGVWSLVFMNISRSLILTIQYWFRSGWRPGFYFRRDLLIKHFYFGYKLALSNLIAILYHNLFLAIVGKIYAPNQLGYYFQAKNLSQYPVNNLTAALKKVTYPLFSDLQDDNVRLQVVFKKISISIFAIILPFMLFGIVNAEPLFLIVLTEKWLPSVPLFQLFCIGALFYPHSIYNLNILAAKGRSDLHLKIEIIKKVVGLAILFLLMRNGLMAVATAYVLGAFFHTGVNLYYSGSLINYPVFKQIKDLSPVFLISIATILITTLISNYILKEFSIYPLANIAISMLLYFIAYFLILKALNIIDIKELITSFTKSK